MKDLRKVIFTGCAMKNEHVKLMLSKEIKELQLGSCHDPDYDCDITKVAAKNLANLISKLHVFKLHNSMMSEMKQNQTCAILCQLIRESHMIKLEIFFNNHLTSIIPGTLSRALTSVTELTLGLQSNHKTYNVNLYLYCKLKPLYIVTLTAQYFSLSKTECGQI